MRKNGKNKCWFFGKVIKLTNLWPDFKKEKEKKKIKYVRNIKGKLIIMQKKENTVKNYMPTNQQPRKWINLQIIYYKIESEEIDNLNRPIDLEVSRILLKNSQQAKYL